jgi:hypothetical protein
VKKGENVPDIVQLVRYHNGQAFADHLVGASNIFGAHLELLAGEGLICTVMQPTIGLRGSHL